jgi:ppGpp synthetase/RelA/SpoT-type nucleotidyltranferase
MGESKIDMDAFKRQAEAYAAVRPQYQVFAEVLQEILSQATRDLGLVAIVQSRAKAVPSFAEKTIRRRDKYPDPLNQMKDLCAARVIVETLDDLQPVREFLEEHFDIDEAEDAGERLGVAEFGYQSVHFTVSLKRDEFTEVINRMALRRGSEGDKFREAVEELYARRSQDDHEGRRLSLGPKYLAEIQVRTLLQHAWSAVGHDRIYKSNFEVPDAYERDANRVAAALEEADQSLARAARGVDSLRTEYGAYMSAEQQREELEKLEAVARYDPDNLEAVARYDADNLNLALQIGRLAATLDDHAKAVDRLKPFVAQWEASAEADEAIKCWQVLQNAGAGQADQDEARRELHKLRDPQMSAVLRQYGQALLRTGSRDGRDYIESALALDPGNVEAHVALARACEHAGDNGEALKHFEQGWKVAPSDPPALAGYLFRRLVDKRQTDFLALVAPQLGGASQRCRDLASVRVYLPHAFYDLGFFGLLRGDPCASLCAYAKAVHMTESEALLNAHRARLEQLHEALGNGLEHLDCVARFFAGATVAKLLQRAEKVADSDREEARQQAEAARDELLGPFRSPDFPDVQTPVVIVAGGADAEFEEQLREYEALLQSAFEGWSGTIISGGTTAGVPGMVGRLPERIRKVACLPRLLPHSVTVDREHYQLYSSTSASGGFSALEPIQMWVDLIASGVNPSEVKLLGINGGDIAAVEYRVAVALGATVGVLRDSGRAASDIARDTDWNRAPELALLPTDKHTVRTFVRGIGVTKCIASEDREKLARETHEKYLAERRKNQPAADAAAVEWDDLKEHFKESNRQQVDHYEAVLRAIGMEIRRAPAGAEVKPKGLKPKQVERMAEIEHARWNVERLLDGWTYGKKDKVNKVSSDLVSWKDLPEETREYDREPMRQIPLRLAALGYEIVPLAGAGAEPERCAP